MTERTITEEELKAVLEEMGHTTTRVNRIIDEAFPPIFKPKEGEAIWVSLVDGHYRLRIFIRMHCGDYLCTSNEDEDDTIFSYKYAKPQTPTQKGE
jgi:hypothetical protein